MSRHLMIEYSSGFVFRLKMTVEGGHHGIRGQGLLYRIEARIKAFLAPDGVIIPAAVVIKFLIQVHLHGIGKPVSSIQL